MKMIKNMNHIFKDNVTLLIVLGSDSIEYKRRSQSEQNKILSKKKKKSEIKQAKNLKRDESYVRISNLIY